LSKNVQHGYNLLANAVSGYALRVLGGAAVCSGQQATRTAAAAAAAAAVITKAIAVDTSSKVDACCAGKIDANVVAYSCANLEWDSGTANHLQPIPKFAPDTYRVPLQNNLLFIQCN
jgi:hypothetical protein